MRVIVLTRVPSPYQVELFNEVAACEDLSLCVLYMMRSEPSRPWGNPDLRHEALFFDEAPTAQVAALLGDADLWVFSWYRDRRVRRLMRQRAGAGRPWCFWGEAPGFRSSGWVGRAWRRILLRELHASGAPIWGIGTWAVERYRSEFGPDRFYVDLPYFSDLSRFAASASTRGAPGGRLLYSGSLIHRKGVDTLAAAWRRASAHFPGARLHVLGDGPLKASMKRTLEGCAAQVIFHGAVDWPELPAFYSKCDFLCAPSRYDGWGLIVPEGLASGMPVIASSRMGSSQEMIRDGVNGWLVEPDDAHGLAERIKAVLGLGGPDYLEMSRRARETAESYDVVRGAERFAQAANASARQLRKMNGAR
jgi:glycosyltransferase involved in cell wall biosynthesis